MKTVDTYAKHTQNRYVAWKANLTSVGSHKLKLKVLATKRRPKIRVDGVIARN